MIKPAGRWDWWEIPFEIVQALGPGVPGLVVRANNVFEIHRTHLPLVAALGYDVPGDAEVSPVDASHGMTWRPWQRRARAWAAPRRGVMLAAQPRLGKTACALSLHEPGRKKRPLVILAPLDVRQVWRDAIEAMWPGMDVLCVEGRTKDADRLREAEAVFIHYDIAVDHRSLMIAPGTLIVDEVHLLSNPNSARTRGALFFAGSADRVVTLSGTPLWNKIRGLWGPMAITNPGAWGGKPFDFSQRYASPVIGEYGWQYGDISNAEEWLARRDQAVFEASWELEYPTLAPTAYDLVDVAINTDMLQALDEEAAAIEIDGGKLVMSATTIGAISRYRKLTGAVKIPDVITRVATLDEPIVTWSWHKDLAKALTKEVESRLNRPAFMIHGDMKPASKRHAVLEAWRQTPNGVLNATMAVGQVGLDMSHARHAFSVEIDWTPAVNYQAYMRTFHPSRPMTCTFFRTGHAVERLLVDNVMMKLGRAAASSMAAAASSFVINPQRAEDNNLLERFRTLIATSDATFSTLAA